MPPKTSQLLAAIWAEMPDSDPQKKRLQVLVDQVRLQEAHLDELVVDSRTMAAEIQNLNSEITMLRLELAKGRRR